LPDTVADRSAPIRMRRRLVRSPSSVSMSTTRTRLSPSVKHLTAGRTRMRSRPSRRPARSPLGS
jgi:hypothetical protein